MVLGVDLGYGKKLVAMRGIFRWIASTLKKLAPLPHWLNWILATVEPIVVLAIAFAVLYVVYWAVFQSSGSSQQVRFKELIEEINGNWKAGILLLVVLFYRTIRIFLEQAEEAFSVKRPLRGEPEEGSKPSSQERA